MINRNTSPALNAMQLNEQNFTELRRGSSLVLSAGDQMGNERDLSQQQTTGNNRRERSGSFTAF